MTTTFIYALKDPDSGEVRYIGKAGNPSNRLKEHLRETKKATHHRANWVRSLLKRGVAPVLEVVDEVSLDDWKAAEAAYIEFYKENGAPLVNTVSGGMGGERGQVLSKESRARMSAARMGHLVSAVTRTRIGASKLGKPRSSETVAKMSMALKGRSLSLDHRKKVSEALRGRVVSAETRMKRRIAATGPRNSSYGKKGPAHFNYGTHRSPASREKMRVSGARRVAHEWVELCLMQMWL